MADEPQKKPMMTFGADGGLVDPSVAPPKKVMRTYASDLASLSGKQPTIAGVAPQAPAPEPAAPAAKAAEPEPVVTEAPMPAIPKPRYEPKLPPLIPKYDIGPETAAPVRAYIPPPPPPPDEYEPPPKAPRQAYSVDAEFNAPAPIPTTYQPMRQYTPQASTEPKEPGFFIRLLMGLFGSKRSSPDEGRIISSTITRRNEAPVPPPPAPVTPPPAPLPPPVIETPPAPLPPPPLPQPVQQAEPIVASAEEERDVVLARLRARVAAREGEALPQTFPTPRPEPSERPRPAYQGPPPNLPGAPLEAGPPQPLQTYSGDFANRIDSERASAFAVIAADADRRKGEPVSAPRRAPDHGLLYVIISTVLIVGGSTSLYLAYSYFAGNQAVSPLTSPISSLIASDERVAIKKADGDPFRLFRDAAEAPLENGSIRVIYLTIATTTATGFADVPQTGTAFINAMRLRAPDILLRNLKPESTVGAVGANGEAHPFFIFATGSYERSFAGMLAWEGTMAQDLAILYPDYPVLDEVGSTTPVMAGTLRTGVFKDEVVESYDVRVLRDAQGRALMLYGYRDTGTLILVRDEAAFAAVLTRFTGTSR